MAYNIDDRSEEDPCQDHGFDTDILGHGVMTSYGILCLLATLYFIVIIAAQYGDLRQKPGRCRNWSQKSPFARRFSESLDTFLDSALVFDTAIIIAVWVSIGKALTQGKRDEDDDDDGVSKISVVLAAAFSLLCAYVPLLLSLVSHAASNGRDPPRPRAHKIRLVVWALVVFMNIIASLVAVLLLDDKIHKDDSIEETCQQHSGWLRYILIAGLVFFVAHAVRSLSYLRLRSSGETHWQAAQRDIIETFDFRLYLGIGTMMYMWMAFFYGLVYKIENEQGDPDAGSYWTFGQMLALATWIPVIFALLIQDVEKSFPSQSDHATDSDPEAAG